MEVSLKNIDNFLDQYQIHLDGVRRRRKLDRIERRKYLENQVMQWFRRPRSEMAYVINTNKLFLNNSSMYQSLQNIVTRHPVLKRFCKVYYYPKLNRVYLVKEYSIS